MLLLIIQVVLILIKVKDKHKDKMWDQFSINSYKLLLIEIISHQ